MKLYTRTGDDGTTGLFGGKRVSKDDPRVEAYGTLDELNAALGVALAIGPPEKIRIVLLRLQNELFDLGAALCTPPENKNAPIRPLTEEHIARLEADIDAACAPLPELRNFILPGGSACAAQLHLARCVCRRAERAIVALSRIEEVDEKAIRYVNRVSDLLFAMARRANQIAGVADVIWK